MRTNMYSGACPECRRGVPKGHGYLYGISDVVVCKECVYLFYGRERGYLVRRPRECARQMAER